MHIYGPTASPAIALAIAENTQRLWNEANGRVVIGGESYNVQFSISHNYVNNDNELDRLVGKATYRDNFIYVANTWRGHRHSITQGSSAFYSTADIADGGGTTEAHEMGHGWGLDHPKELNGQDRADFRGLGAPSIMWARNSVVDATYQINPSASPGLPNGVLNPTTRCVTQQDIEALGLHREPSFIGLFNAVQFGRADVPIMPTEQPIVSPPSQSANTTPTPSERPSKIRVSYV